MKTVAVKIQTKRSTNYKEGIININVFTRDFDFGIVTSNAWGDFKERKESVVTIGRGGRELVMPMSEFTEVLEGLLPKKDKE